MFDNNKAANKHSETTMISSISAYLVSAVFLFVLGHQHVDALSPDLRRTRPLVDKTMSRRLLLGQFVAIGAGAFATRPAPALAAADCVTDCLKNCKKIAPKDPDYCAMNCRDYCEQDDRTDGLSGSVSAASGEVGILGGAWGQGTVPKDEDKLPGIKLPGLDFSTDNGKKLLGYQ